MRIIIICLLFCIPIHSFGQKPQEAGQEAEIIQTIQSFFDAMAEKDTVTLAALMHPSGVYFVTQAEKPIKVNTHAAYLKNFPMGKEYRFKEEIWDPTVMVDGDLAILWAPYNFYLNDVFEHCGIDAFSLVKENGKWMIATTVFSVSKTPCNE